MLNKDLFDVELNYTCVEGFLKSSASNETEFLLQTLNLNSLYLCNPLSYTYTFQDYLIIQNLWFKIGLL